MTKVTTLAKSMAAKKRIIQGKVNTLNSAAFSQAMTIYQRTGNYPNINLPTANTVGAEALRYAMTRRGDPYVWGAAGPSEFDCSGLVMWAYAQVGISLPHYTVSQYNMGEHISRSQLEPGDLVFFYAGIDHVGIYLGGGLMVDAPSTGQLVQVQPVMWNVFVGAVRII
jgi:cell wall-associated NlpC family hydrolase